MVIQAVDHMTAIVQGLKDFARASSFELKEVDVNDVVEPPASSWGRSSARAASS